MSRQDFSQIQQFYRPTNVGVYDPQSNPAQDFFGGFKQGQEIVDRQEITRQRQLQNQQVLAEEERKVRIDTLADLSAKGDYNALNTLVGLDATRAKPIIDRQYQKISRIGQLAEGVNRVGQTLKPIQYKNALKQAQLEGIDVSGMPEKWSDEAQQFIDFQINSSKSSKEFLDEKKYELDAALNKARIDTERAQQAKYYADAARMKGMSGGAGNENIDPVLSRQVDKEVIINNRKSGDLASDSLRSLEQIENALFDSKGNPKVNTGKSKAALEYAGQIIPFVDSSNYQDVVSKSQKLSLDVSSMLKGQTSDKDVERSLLTTPSFDKEPPANKQIIKDQKAALTVVAETPKFTAAWRNRYGSTLGTDEQGRTYDEAKLDFQAKRFKELGGVKESESVDNVAEGTIRQSRKTGQRQQFTGGQWRDL